MKYKKLVAELNSLLDSVARQRDRHQKKVKQYLEQFKSEEKELRKQLENETDKGGREKLERDLGLVKQAYAILDPNY